MAVAEYSTRDRIAFVRLNRPEAKNAINPELHARLWQIWQDFDADDSVDVAILTGTGDAFCAGADLKHYMTRWPGATPQQVRSVVKDGLGGLTRGLHRTSKPIIAAVNGWALAGGFETALACDIRIASENARFGSFEGRRGFHHGDGGIPRLVNSAGVGVAMQMLLTAEPITAETALQWNLVTEVVPHDKLMERAELIARQILRNDQTAVRSAKETILDMIGRGLDDQLRIEALNGYSVASRDEVPERLQSFYDKTDRGRYGSHATAL
ncbi:enoyl-CoA hydratase/isomerase family protein [Nocardia sp. NPDC049707]|uniref:enoyl-CoA hydratase/isomerase family protein n=1 Tax=Nocardia sp. NPDC049707 TaxID=3154735 RepID=UPI003434D8C2